MIRNQNVNDWLNLSVYIDGEMKAAEKARLEQRLQNEPQLRLQLNQIKANRALLHALPKHKVPHNFVLTPDMVKGYKKSTWLPVFSYASAASAMIALVMILVQFIPGVLQNKSSSMAAQPAAELAMSAQSDINQTGSPEIIFWGGPPPLVQAEGKGGGAAEDTMPYNPPAMTLSGPAEVGATLLESAPSTEGAVQPPSEMSTVQEQPLTTAATAPATASSETTLRSEPTQSSDAGEGSSPILGLRPAAEGSNITVPEISQTAPVRQPFSPMIAYLFAALAGVTGVVAYIFWRRTR